MPQPRVHLNHAARQAAYRARQKEKDLQPSAPPVSCPSPTCPLGLSADVPWARSAVFPASGSGSERTLLQIHEERRLRQAVGDLLFAAQRCGLIDKGDANETPDQCLYRWAKELWKQKPKP